MIVSVTKGIEARHADDDDARCSRKSRRRPIGSRCSPDPGFAAEVARGKPAALVAAAPSTTRRARRAQALFAARTLRIYRSNDVVGVELAARSRT